MSNMRAMVARRPLRLIAVLAVGLMTLLVVTQAFSAPTNFVNVTNHRIRWNGTGNFDWANGFAGDPGVSTGAHTCTPAAANVIAGSVINCPGTNGLFDGGVYNGSTTPPTPPNFIASDATIVAHTFGVDPLSGDVTQCSPTQTLTGDPTVYTGAGSEKNGDLLSSDTWGNGSVPPKDDLANIYAIAHKSGSVNEILFAAERNFTSGQGDSHIDFEFLQSAVHLTPSGPGPTGVCSGGFSGNRAQGDMILSVDFTKGGTLGGETLYIWTCAAPSPTGTICNPAANGPANGNQYVATSSATLLNAVTFGVNCTVPSGSTTCDGAAPVDCGGWACRHADGTYESTVDTNKFMEGGIDLTALGFNGCISSFLPHTRSSQSFTATLKDFALLNFNTCSTQLTTNIIVTSGGADVTNSTVPKGTVVHDTATVTGSGDGVPTGTVSFLLYPNGTCAGSTFTTQAGTTLTGSGTTATSASPDTTANAALSYKATYTPDAASPYPAVPASAVACEKLGVTTSSIVTKIIRNDTSADVTGSTVPTGTTVHDTATVTGSGDGSSTPTGTITFKLFATGDCTGSSTNEAVTPLTAGAGTTATAASSDTIASGALSYKASYSGDTIYPASADSSCEQLGVTTSSIVTKIIRNDTSADVTGSTVPTGTTVHDTATVTGSGDGTSKPTGTITFKLYATGDCTGASTSEAVSPLTAGTGTTASAASSNTTANAALSYTASYGGDGNYPASSDSTCEKLGVTTSSIVTKIIRNDTSADVTGSTVPTGTTVHDTATVTGSGDGASVPTGTVTFKLYATGDCTGSSTSEAVSPLTAGAGTTASAASSNTTANAALSYTASYSGDVNYPASADSSCEQLGVTTSSIVTHIIRNTDSADVTNTNVIVGTVVHDTATVTGAGDGASVPTGTITFKLYATNDCTGSSTSEAVSPLAAGAGTTASAASSNATASTNLSYTASYSGDLNYPASTDSACESLTIVNPATRLSILDQITNLPSDATGSVTYDVFTDSGCTTAVTTGVPSDGHITPAVNAVGAGGVAPSSLIYTPAGSGTFFIKATFTGTGSYAGVVFTSCTESAVITE